MCWRRLRSFVTFAFIHPYIGSGSHFRLQLITMPRGTHHSERSTKPFRMKRAATQRADDQLATPKNAATQRVIQRDQLATPKRAAKQRADDTPPKKGAAKQQAASSKQQEGGEAAKVRLRVLKRPASSKVAEAEWKRSVPTAVPLTRRLKINDSDASIASSDHLKRGRLHKGPRCKVRHMQILFDAIVDTVLRAGLFVFRLWIDQVRRAYEEHTSYPDGM